MKIPYARAFHEVISIGSITTLTTLPAEVSDGEKERGLCRPQTRFLSRMRWRFLNNSDVMVTCDTTYRTGLRAKNQREACRILRDVRTFRRCRELHNLANSPSALLLEQQTLEKTAFKGETTITTGSVEKRSLETEDNSAVGKLKISRIPLEEKQTYHVL